MRLFKRNTLRASIVRRIFGTVSILLIVTAGCAVPGNPMPEHPDLGALDVGPYPREPLPVPPSGDEKYGRVIESVRMGEAVIDPTEADAALSFGLSGNGAVPLPTPAKAAGFLAGPVRAVLEKRGMLAGFAVSAADREVSSRPQVGTCRLLTVIVLRFPDPDAARQAAREIDSVDFAVNTENAAVPIPDYPEAQAHWRPTVPTLAATTSIDSYVVSVLAGHTGTDLPALTGLARKTFGVQLPRLREFAATPLDRIASLPLDQEGMVRRQVPALAGRWSYPTVVLMNRQEVAGWDSLISARGVVYGPRAARRFIRQGGGDFDAIAVNGTDFLARYPDAATAKQHFDAAARKGGALGLRPIPAPDGTRDVLCYVDDSIGQSPGVALIKYSCRVLYGRYLAQIFSRVPQDIRQKAASQYALLVGSG
ncbi:DUF7373 family lipoprotein [Nocardia arthritidis]|uniref:Uncharacterized protein n=1 Tax=Nocardia arthritidis TaxID=228602 RepID=A0A6G9YB71_9NOCA|nr:hypothetical protein [Nocardia arthritidis]QIS10380.1 hypothetical protein F5544_12445 [Nocardia arthritidis]